MAEGIAAVATLAHRFESQSLPREDPEPPPSGVSRMPNGQSVVSYNRQTLRGDIFGGVTAAVVGLPMALAFGVASGLGPIAGLYGAIAVGFLAAVFGERDR